MSVDILINDSLYKWLIFYLYLVLLLNKLEFVEVLNLDIRRTKLYYEQISNSDLCDCAYCQNYVREIKATYPEITEYLFSLGVDIEKPFEIMPLEPDESGYIEYISVQYIIYGDPNDFDKTVIESINVDITDVHPATQINESHFVIEIYPVRLKWIM